MGGRVFSAFDLIAQVTQQLAAGGLTVSRRRHGKLPTKNAGERLL